MGFEFAEDLALVAIRNLLYLALPEEEATEVYGWVVTAFEVFSLLVDLCLTQIGGT